MRGLSLLGLTLMSFGQAHAKSLPPDWVATPWPSVIPCKQLDRLAINPDSFRGYRVQWHSEAGAPLRFELPPLKLMPDNTVVGNRDFDLGSAFPIGRLTKMRMLPTGRAWADYVDTGVFELELKCKDVAGAIHWKCNSWSGCTLETTYYVSDDHPRPRYLYEHNWLSKNSIGQPAPRALALLKAGPSDQASVVALVRDLVHDADGFLDFACSNNRCSDRVLPRMATIARLSKANAWSIGEVDADSQHLSVIANAGSPSATVHVSCKYSYFPHVGFYLGCSLEVDKLVYMNHGRYEDSISVDDAAGILQGCNGYGSVLPSIISIKGSALRTSEAPTH